MVSVFLQLQATILLSNYISQGLASSVTIKPMVDVVICGGGLGGLALANGLINNGFSVACFEKNGEIWPTGAMTILKPNAFKALKDLKPELEKIMIDNGVKETVFGGTMYAWANIRNLLLPSDLDLHSSSTFVDLEDKEDSYIESRFLCKDHGIEKINTIRSRVFIGADGINSAVNKFLNGRQAKLSGSYSWRCTIDSAPDAIEGEGGITKLIGNRYVTTINVANRKTCWAAGIQKGASTITESSISKTNQEIKEDLLKDYAEFPQGFLDMVIQTDPADLFYGPVMVHEMPLAEDQGWGGSGRVALLGDSAHGLRPASGQGAAMAFEDAVILCRKLKEVKDLSVRNDVCNALRNYENERLVRVRRVQEWTSDQVRLAYSVPTDTAGIATGDEGAAIALLEELREKIAKGEKAYNEWLFQGV